MSNSEAFTKVNYWTKLVTALNILVKKVTVYILMIKAEETLNLNSKRAMA